MKRTDIPGGRRMTPEHIDRIWAQAWQHVKAQREERQRSDDAMRRAGQQLREKEGRPS